MIVDAIVACATGALVTVLLDGRTIDASDPAFVAHGVTLAPLAPFVRDIAERVDLSRDGTRVRLVRGTHDVVVRVATPQCGERSRAQSYSIAACVPLDSVRIPLATVARALGASVSYDARARTLSIALAPEPLTLFSVAPYIAPAPGTVPTFAPTSVPMPRPTVTGIPRPRRTPVLIETSPLP